MIAGLTAGLANAALGVLAKITTQAFFEKLITKVVIYMLEKLAASTKNTIDDNVVADIKEQLNEG